jgi:hypothetical protein
MLHPLRVRIARCSPAAPLPRGAGSSYITSPKSEDSSLQPSRPLAARNGMVTSAPRVPRVLINVSRCLAKSPAAEEVGDGGGHVATLLAGERRRAGA